MLILLLPLIAALVTPLPVPPSSAHAPSALKEIGRVESLSVCSAIVVHANSAISVALDNDRDLALIINRLRTTDLDTDNEITRRNGSNDLSTLAGRIRLAAAAGSGELKRLRTMDAQTAEPTRKVELKAFTDALSGAITRQRKAATELDAMLTIIDGRRAVAEINTPPLVGERAAIASPGGPLAPTLNSAVLRNPAAPVTPARVDAALHSVADDFTVRTQAILNDEGVAADHALGATTGC